MKVNGNDADPGCYIAGHHGQYGLDALGDLAEQFGIELDDEDDPRYWRRAAEAETSEDTVIVSNGPNRIGNHIASYEECFERQVWAADKTEEILNDAHRAVATGAGRMASSSWLPTRHHPTTST